MEEEFEEGEVWDVGRGKKDAAAAAAVVVVSPEIRKQKEVKRCDFFIGEQSGRQSLPVNVPNWSKIHKRNCEKEGEEEEEEDDDGGDNLPPHEWLARKMARSRISSSSVCEGAGRTLKGRDQRKVREAVLSRTGFLE